MNSIVARAATEVTGLPPNVEIVKPWYDAASSFVVIVAPIGAPLAMPFAHVMMSGVTSQCSMPNHFLRVRPKPVYTSPDINTPPYFFTALKTIFKYSGGGVINPAPP